MATAGSDGGVETRRIWAKLDLHGAPTTSQNPATESAVAVPRDELIRVGLGSPTALRISRWETISVKSPLTNEFRPTAYQKHTLRLVMVEAYRSFTSLRTGVGRSDTMVGAECLAGEVRFGGRMFQRPIKAVGPQRLERNVVWYLVAQVERESRGELSRAQCGGRSAPCFSVNPLAEGTPTRVTQGRSGGGGEQAGRRIGVIHS